MRYTSVIVCSLIGLRCTSRNGGKRAISRINTPMIPRDRPKRPSPISISSNGGRTRCQWLAALISNGANQPIWKLHDELLANTRAAVHQYARTRRYGEYPASLVWLHALGWVKPSTLREDFVRIVLAGVIGSMETPFCRSNQLSSMPNRWCLDLFCPDE